MALPLHYSQLSPLFTSPNHQQPHLLLPHTKPHFPKTKTCHFPNLTNPKLNSTSSINSIFIDQFVQEQHENNGGFMDKLSEWIQFIQSIGPGGSFWGLPGRVGHGGSSVTALSMLRRLWDLLADDRWVVYSAFGALSLAALSDISIPHFLTASIFSAQNVETAVFKGNAKLLILLCFNSAVCSGIRGCCFNMANMIIVKRMREKLYSAILVQDISFFDSETVGDLTSRLGSDCQQVSTVISGNLNMIFRGILQGTGALIYLFILSWPLALSTLVICSVLSTITLFYAQYQKKTAILTQEFTAYANEVTQETFSLVRTVRVYGTEKQQLGRYQKWLRELAEISLQQSVAYGFWNSSFNTLYRSTQVIAVLVGGASIMAGNISAEKLTKYILYCEWLIYAAWRVGDHLSSFMQSFGASEKVFQLMDLLPSDEFLSKGIKLQRMVGHIEFVNVSFQYSSRETAHILQHVNFSVNPNEVVAIVGRSGSGKSTIVNLLLHLYEPTNGQILIDGFSLNDLDTKWFRENIGYVGQEPRLFRMDVSSNIRYGCTRDVSQEEVELAAKQAYVHEFISYLPNGYKTLVDDDLLSGGQKQRLAIARAILRDPSILILDEATSALDAESEHNVKGILHASKGGSKKNRTVIVIAHRLSTIQAADQVIVVDEGQVVEMGTHSELLWKNGLYATLINRQAGTLM